MAIQVDVTLSAYGIPFQGAYFQIHNAHVMRGGDPTAKFSVVLDVYGFATSTPEPSTRFVDHRRYVANLADVEAQSGAEFLEKCYAWVMSQPDMVGAVGV